MNPKTFAGIELKHFGSYIPSDVITNDDIMVKMESKCDGSLLYRTVGSKEKRVARESEMGSDMMTKVAKRILKEANVTAKDIDKLICSCDPQDQAAPDAAVITQAKVGLSCPSFGVSMSCSAWLCGVLIGCGFMNNGDKKILVLAASTVGSKYFFRTPVHRAIFGDGAGGVLLEKTGANSNILSLELLTDGNFYKEIFAPHPWTAVPEEIPAQYKNAFYMSPDNHVFFDAIDNWILPFYRRQYDNAQVSSSDISLFIIHQASMPIFNYTLKSLKIPEAKVAGSFDRYGNTVSAELPIMIDEVIRTQRVRKGDLVYLLTYGAGFTAGAMILRI